MHWLKLKNRDVEFTVYAFGASDFNRNIIWIQFDDENTIGIDSESVCDDANIIYKIIGIKYDAKQSYSTEEQIVGTWIDGKPLYRKVILKDTLSSGSINLGIDNVDFFKVTDFQFTRKTQSGGIVNNTSAYWYSANDYVQYFYMKNGIFFTFSNGYTENSFSNFVIVCEYTKTTDAATITE